MTSIPHKKNSKKSPTHKHNKQQKSHASILWIGMVWHGTETNSYGMVWYLIYGAGILRYGLVLGMEYAIPWV